MENFWTTILITLVLLLLIYNLIFKENHFKKYKIPYLTPLPLLGNMAPVLFRQETFAENQKKLYDLDSSAKYIGFYNFNNPVVMIRDLDLIKSITVKHFDHFTDHRPFIDPDLEPLFSNNLLFLKGERWREVRNLLSPAFTASKMKAMFKLMCQCANTFCNSLEDKLHEGQIDFESKDIFTRYTNDVIATCAFGIAVDSMKDPKNQIYVLGTKATKPEGMRTLKFFAAMCFPRLFKFLRIKIFDDEVVEFFHKLVKETIEVRDKQNISRPDMIQLMMEARENNKPGSKGPVLTIESMVSQAFIFFFGGFDTTATLMCFVAHEVAANCEIQKKLQAEIDEVFERCDDEVTYEAVNGMQYLDAVINEALRMYPVLGLMDRLCTKSFELPPTLPGSEKFTVQVGDQVWFPVWTIQRDEKYFERPDSFDPDRFCGEAKAKINTNAYMPFGAGPRMCIGSRFALLEIKIMLMYLFRKFDVKPAKKMIMPMRLAKQAMAVMADGGFWLELEVRK